MDWLWVKSPRLWRGGLSGRKFSRRVVGAIGLGLVILFIATRSPTALLTIASPKAPGGEIRGVAYLPGPRHAFDVYLPEPRSAPSPVAVFFYGGGWRQGDRAGNRFIGRSLAACGVMTFIPDYRVWPDVAFPDFLKDAAAAVARVKAEARRMGGDPDQLFLMGYSAGAYIAAMLALDPSWLEQEGIDPRTDVAGVIGIAGPYDFLPLRKPAMRRIFGAGGAATQPIAFAANAVAPILLLAGGQDRVVDPANSQRLAASVRASGHAVEAIVFADLGHLSIIRSMAWPLHFLAPVWRESCRFLRGHTRRVE